MATRSVGPTTTGAGVKLGIFAVITAMALVMLTDALGGIRLWGGSGYTAMFTDATGVLPGDEVRIAGVKVGEVESVSLKQGKPPLAEVEFSLDDDRTVPSDVHAQIKYRNLVGQRYISLSRPADRTGAAEELQPGAVLGVRQTTPALNLTVLLNGFKPLFAALSPEEVNELSFEIIQVLQGEGTTVESLLSHTASLTSTLASRDDTIGAVIENLTEVLTTVSEREDALDTSIGRLTELISGLADDSDALGEAIVSIGTLTTETSQLVEDARPALDADIEALEVVAGTLNDNSEVLETALARLPETYAALTTTGSYGSWFNFFLCDADGSIGLNDDTAINPVELHSPMARCQQTGEQ